MRGQKEELGRIRDNGLLKSKGTHVEYLYVDRIRPDTRFAMTVARTTARAWLRTRPLETIPCEIAQFSVHQTDAGFLNLKLNPRSESGVHDPIIIDPLPILVLSRFSLARSSFSLVTLRLAALIGYSSLASSSLPSVRNRNSESVHWQHPNGTLILQLTIVAGSLQSLPSVSSFLHSHTHDSPTSTRFL
jgi:hypothetical protein